MCLVQLCRSHHSMHLCACDPKRQTGAFQDWRLKKRLNTTCEWSRCLRAGLNPPLHLCTHTLVVPFTLPFYLSHDESAVTQAPVQSTDNENCINTLPLSSFLSPFRSVSLSNTHAHYHKLIYFSLARPSYDSPPLFLPSSPSHRPSLFPAPSSSELAEQSSQWWD